MCVCWTAAARWCFVFQCLTVICNGRCHLPFLLHCWHSLTLSHSVSGVLWVSDCLADTVSHWVTVSLSLSVTLMIMVSDIECVIVQRHCITLSDTECDTVSRSVSHSLSLSVSLFIDTCVTLSDSDTVTECDTDDNGVRHWVCQCSVWLCHCHSVWLCHTEWQWHCHWVWHCSLTLVSHWVTVSLSLSVTLTLSLSTVTECDSDTVSECDTDDNGVWHLVCHCSVTVCQLRCFAWRHYTRDVKLKIYSELIIDSS